jgi:hypothetical protein
MKWFKAIIAWVAMVLAGMRGGQKDKVWRRVGFPVIAVSAGWSFGWSWKYLAFLLFIPILSMGYGVDSIMWAWCFHIEWIIRLVYALLLSLPFYIFCLWRGVVASVMLIAACSLSGQGLWGIYRGLVIS